MSAREPADLIPLLLKALATSPGVEIILIPVPRLLFRSTRVGGASDILDVVTRPRAHQPNHSFGPQGGDDAGGPATQS